MAYLPRTSAELAGIALARMLEEHPEIAYKLFRSYAKRQPGLFPAYTYFGFVTAEADGTVMPVVVNRRPVAWKGRKFGRFGTWPSDEELSARTGAPVGVIQGLRRAIGISKQGGALYRENPGRYGRVAVIETAGGLVVLPGKVFAQGERSIYDEKAAAWLAWREASVKGSNVAEAISKAGYKVRLVRPKTALGIPRMRRRGGAPTPATPR